MWNVMSPLATAVIAGVVSLVVTVMTTRSTTRSAKTQALQTQFTEIIKKRVEIYPKLWRIHIHYETNWTLEGKLKTGEWAQEYVEALNEFNLEGGLYFSQDLYERFVELRRALYEARDKTLPGEVVPRSDTQKIREIVYGGKGRAGLSTHLKDDLGSYRFTFLQRRTSRLHD
jgi:hypothetical protein